MVFFRNVGLEKRWKNVHLMMFSGDKRYRTIRIEIHFLSFYSQKKKKRL